MNLLTEEIRDMTMTKISQFFSKASAEAYLSQIVVL